MDELTLKENLQVYKGGAMQISDSCKTRIENLPINLKHTRIRNRILITQFICLTALIVFIPVTTYAMVTISQTLIEKVKDAGLSEHELTKLDDELKESGFTDEQIAGFNSLKMNEYGQTYGPDAFGADLIAVLSEDGTEGYVYRDELYPENNFKTPDEALDWQNSRPKNRSIKVYESDGKTIIGEYKHKSESVYEEN